MEARMTRRRFLRAAGGLAAGWGGLRALGGRGAAAGEARRPAPWRHGTIPPRADSMFQVMAQEKGFFRAAGLEVQFQYFESGITVVQALVAGEVDTIDVAPAGTLVSISRGAKLKLIGSFGTALPYLLYTKADIASYKDLAGRAVAISQPGALADVLMRAILERQGLDPKAMGIEWLAIGGDAARFQALVAGRADATIDHVEYLSRARQNGLRVLASAPEVLPHYVRFATATSDRVLRDRFEDLVRYCTALTRGIRYSLEHREETIDLGARTAKRDRADVARVYDWFIQNKGLEPDFALTPEKVQYTQDLNVRLGTQARALPLDEAATWEVQRRVVEALGAYRR